MKKKKEIKKPVKKVVKGSVKTEIYRENGESKVKTTYPNGTVNVSTL